MKKTNVAALDPDWIHRLASKKAPEAKARKALEAVERRADLRLVTRPKRIMPAVGWADPSERLYTIEELAEHLRVAVATIKRAERRGEIVGEPCGKDGKILRFSRASIDAYKTHMAKKRHG